MSSLEDKNYVHHYQYTKFQESDTDPFIACNVKRKCLAQTYQASAAIASNATTCFLLEDDLRSYADLVDNKEADGVNNYAMSILAMVSRTRNANSCEQWKSGLKSVDPNKFIQLLESPKCDLADNMGFCQSANITEEDINLLLANRNHKLAGDNEDVGKPNPRETHFQSFTSQGSVVHNSDGDRRSNNASWGSMCEGQNSKATRPERQYFSGHHPVYSPTARGGSSRMDIDQGIGERRSFDQGAVERTTMQPLNQVYYKGNASTTHSGYGETPSPPTMFTTAREELVVQNAKKWGSHSGGQGSASTYGNKGYSTGNQGYSGNHGYGASGDPQSYDNQGSRGPVKKVLGTRRTVTNKFIPPFRTDNNEDHRDQGGKQGSMNDRQTEEIDERLKNIDPKMIELIRSEIMDTGAAVAWDDIAGLEFAKATIQEIVVWPLLRPDIFTGLRRPPKGILLFGPPGTGKTLIGKCIASQSCSTFFSISASSLTSKWIGDGEKMVRALFAVASCHQPAVVFIDEIDSLLTQRSDTEHESSRRIKTEFLVQLDGATTGEEDRTLVIGATNRPQELDEAARRRLVKRLYIPLPEVRARRQLVERLMSSERHSLTNANIDEISQLTDGYSGADMKNLCQEASLGPIRSLGMIQIQHIQPNQVREVNLSDFKAALTRVRASVSPDDLDNYVKWDKTFGSGGAGVT